MAGKQAATIFSYIREKVGKFLVGTINALIGWWRAVKSSGKALKQAMFRLFPNFLEFPTFTYNPKLIRVKVDAVAEIGDGEVKPFRGIQVDVDIESTTTEIAEAIESFIINIQSPKYFIRSVTFDVTQAYAL